MSSPKIIRDRHLNSNRNLDLGQSSSSSRSDGLSLGITTGFASTPENTGFQDSLVHKLDNNENRYALQKIAQKYHPDSRICACMKSMNPGQDFVELHYKDTERHAHYRNLMRCDNVWLCPVCAGRITSKRAEEMRQAYAHAVDVLKWRVVMVTYTMRHDRYQSLDSNLDAMREARRKMRSGRKWKKAKSDYGIQGGISALEVTWSQDAGWHVHVHEILFLDDSAADYDLSVDDRKLEVWMKDSFAQHWIDSLQKVGRTATIANGLDVKATDKYIAEYIAKHGKLPQGETWDIALELAKSHLKKSAGGLHPFQILELSDRSDIDDDKRKMYQALWFEYAAAFAGRAQQYWTVGLKEKLLIEEVADDEIEEPGVLVMYLNREVWHDIKQMNKRATLLNNCILWRGDRTRLNKYLKILCHDAHFERKKKEYWSKL